MKKKKRNRAMTHEEEEIAAPTEVLEADAPAAEAPAVFFEGPKGKEWKYVGPADNRAEIRIEGDPERYHPADLPQRHIEFYMQSTPQNAGWWE